MAGSNKGIRALGFVGLLCAAAAVFVVCSIVQGIGHSSMFQTTFPKPNNFVLEIAMQVTFYPGWIVTAGCVLGAFAALLGNDTSGD